MKIELIRQKFDRSMRYKYKPFQYCCDNLQNNPCVEFTDQEYEDERIPVFALVKHEVFTDWEDEYEQEIYYEIKFCPFCGEPIEISVVGEEDVDDVFKDLRKQREELWEKYKHTDSKKKSQELYEKVHELDNQIDWFYQLVEYKNVRIREESK